MDAQFCKAQSARRMILRKLHQQNHRRNGVCRNRCNRNALHGHSGAEHKDQVQDHVQNSGRGEHPERRSGIAFCVQHRHGKVCECDKRQTEKINMRIQRCQLQQFPVVSHQGKDGFCHKKAKSSAEYPEKQAEKQRSMHRLFGLLVVLFTDGMGKDHLRSDRASHKQAHDQIDECGSRSHRPHCIRFV